jgi:hypothetical protein
MEAYAVHADTSSEKPIGWERPLGALGLLRRLFATERDRDGNHSPRIETNAETKIECRRVRLHQPHQSVELPACTGQDQLEARCPRGASHRSSL